MEDILKSKLSATAKSFWYGVGVKIQKRVKGVVQVLYNEITNSIVIKIFFEKFNYIINTEFPCSKLLEESFVVNSVLNSVRFNIVEELFE